MRRVREAERALDFLDGYLFRQMMTMLKSEGVNSSGLYDYYRSRVEEERIALSAYDRILLRYILTKFDCEQRQVVHAGIGLGTLASALARSGFRVVGIEADEKRYKAASQMRDALGDAWPDAASRYILLRGWFPAIVVGADGTESRSILVFTNCGAGWSEEMTAQIIGELPRYGDVFLDTRLFGKVRDTPEEREALVEQIRRQSLSVTPIPRTRALNAFYCHVHRRKRAP